MSFPKPNDKIRDLRYYETFFSKSSLLLHLIGDFYLHLNGNKLKALGYYERAFEISHEPNTEGKIQQCVKYLADEHFMEAYYNQKIIDKENYQTAIIYFLRWHTFQPENSYPLVQLGWSYFVIGDLENSRIHSEKCVLAEKSLNINSNNRYALMNWGHTFLCKGDMKTAFELYQQSFDTSSWDKSWFERDFNSDHRFVNMYKKISKQKYGRIRSAIVYQKPYDY